MITENEIETAFGQELASPEIAPIVWPNKTSALPPKPYIVVQHVPATRNSPGMAGGGQIVGGAFVLTVVTGVNQFSTEANTLAAQIMARFSKASTLTAGTGKLRIGPADPVALAPDRQDGDWRQPVRVTYTATAR